MERIGYDGGAVPNAFGAPVLGMQAMVTMSTSGWLDRYIAAREASLESLTDLDRAGQGVVDRDVRFGTLTAALRSFFCVHRSRRRALTDMDDRVFADLGLARRQVVAMAARATEARWTARDPLLPPVANANSRFRAA
ncbi:hypothetical protein GCM10017083_31960 [Thalassobaculum fulvum]|uniref:DUF1127 domain-containing protein n=1 Tax=Thalassobaculum fulvum TaxID=1633335 RepID=A0A919CQB2_9PROT|nr:hypothetical protein GCM10017083_31960 [Thalassobaculum fulvum]